MAMSPGGFAQAALELTRNPLGVIGLFVVLVYAIAAFATGLAARYLQPCERLPLIWFIVLFPVLLLGTFVWLVVYHHTKLIRTARLP